MFDRIGRISDETPFVVEWFAQHDVRIWSAVEGEQKFESHVDKLTNYIRYWQADGESRKTAERVANSMAILTSEGCYTCLLYTSCCYQQDHVGRSWSG